MDKDQGNSESADFSASKPEKIGGQDNSSANKQMVKSPVSKVGVVCDFTDTVSIRVKDKYFNVPRDLLVANSNFFDDALSHGEPKKFFLVLDDVDADIFNFFINVLLESSFSTTYKMSQHNASSRCRGTQSFLRLWKLSHRFNNRVVCALAEEALRTQCFESSTPEYWEQRYIRNTEAWMQRRVRGMQQCYNLCKEESIPFERDFVIVCANCPGQVVADHFDQLDPGFRAEVMKTFAIRMADPQVTKRKRDHEDEGKRNASGKRRCLNSGASSPMHPGLETVTKGTAASDAQ
ncbi:hypothetical protein DHEL01_v200876 [Diaporthe helianthi]|uniref:BTB domain-containing protein n=1 Tax=Diaporthe helianthi TaxID=158607 RepID=A0A2P5IE11_DIAHE|nr:hypothetical protein DHEL01_v200876 [Diaporthe helianthi]